MATLDHLLSLALDATQDVPAEDLCDALIAAENVLERVETERWRVVVQTERVGRVSIDSTACSLREARPALTAWLVAAAVWGGSAVVSTWEGHVEEVRLWSLEDCESRRRSREHHVYDPDVWLVSSAEDETIDAFRRELAADPVAF